MRLKNCPDETQLISLCSLWSLTLSKVTDADGVRLVWGIRKCVRLMDGHLMFWCAVYACSSDVVVCELWLDIRCYGIASGGWASGVVEWCLVGGWAFCAVEWCATYRWASCAVVLCVCVAGGLASRVVEYCVDGEWASIVLWCGEWLGIWCYE